MTIVLFQRGGSPPSVQASSLSSPLQFKQHGIASVRVCVCSVRVCSCVHRGVRATCRSLGESSRRPWKNGRGAFVFFFLLLFPRGVRRRQRSGVVISVAFDESSSRDLSQVSATTSPPSPSYSPQPPHPSEPQTPPVVCRELREFALLLSSAPRARLLLDHQTFIT